MEPVRNAQDGRGERAREFIDAYADPRFCGWAIDSEGKLVGTIGAYGYGAEKGV